MLAHIKTIAFRGIEAVPIHVEVHLSSGKIVFNIVGLPDKAVGESKERIRAALSSLGLGLPAKRITVNLSPAALPKEGSHYDLPIALGVMVAMGAIENNVLDDYVVMGELGLDGRLAPIRGALPAGMAALGRGLGLICPQQNGGEAAWSGLSKRGEGGILAPEHILQLVNHLKGTHLMNSPLPSPNNGEYRDRSNGGIENGNGLPDLADVRGQLEARFALEVAAAGGHHLLFSGPPGAGKSMLAQRLPSILPPLLPYERLEMSVIKSVGGESMEGLATRRPFRAPHHSASMAALTGGGRMAKPGEVSLAHCGVLFLDELPEFSAQALDALRQPIETGRVEVARAQAHITYPARFQLVAAMNPCRCGNAHNPELACHRLPHCMSDYLRKLSGPLMDRFDMRITLPPTNIDDMVEDKDVENSKTILSRVMKAREIQLKRNGKKDGHPVLNAQLEGEALLELASLDKQADELLQKASKKRHITARGYHRMLRVARTLADLEEQDKIAGHHISSALEWRGPILQARPSF